MGERKDRGERSEESFGQYIDHSKRILKLFRIWKLGDDLPKWKTTLVTVNTVVLLASNFLLGLAELKKLQNAGDLAQVASGIGNFWFHFLGFFKWLYLVWKTFSVVDLVEQLEECYKLSLALSDSDEDSSRLREEMSVAKKSSLKFLYVWIFLLSYGIVHWCINPVLLESISTSSANTSLDQNERALPYEAWIPWDTEEPSGYWYAYLFEFVGSSASGIGTVSHDAFYLTLVMMTCAQFRYLNYVLGDLRERNSAEASIGTRNKLVRSFLGEKLKRSKDYHCAMLKFLASLEKMTSPVMFVQCIGTMGILCLVSFEMTTIELKGDVKNSIKVWSMFEYIIGTFTQLFAFCYYANEVTTLGLQVGDSAYSCGWESLESDKSISADDGATKKERKAVGFLIREIIIRAQTPIRLTGGPFYVLSLETYRAVVSAAFSYSAVLRELGEE